MQSIQRALPVTALVAALIGAACGGGSPTQVPAMQTPGGTAAGATPGTGTSGTGGVAPQDLPGSALAPIFGAGVPEPTCGDMVAGGSFCRWETTDQSIVLDVQRDDSITSEADWREAYGTAGFDEELTGLGIPALGGTTPLAAGYRATAFGPDNVAWTVSLTHGGDAAAVKAMVLAVLGALAAS